MAIKSERERVLQAVSRLDDDGIAVIRIVLESLAKMRRRARRRKRTAK